MAWVGGRECERVPGMLKEPIGGRLWSSSGQRYRWSRPISVARRWICRASPGQPQGFPGDSPGTPRGTPRASPGPPKEIPRSILRASQEHPQNFPGVPPELPRSFPRASQEHPQRFPTAFPFSSWHPAPSSDHLSSCFYTSSSTILIYFLYTFTPHSLRLP